VHSRLAGKTFGRVKVDISPRAHELDATDEIALPNSLSFAGISVPTIEVIDIQRHAAEKLHGMHRDSATATTPESAISSTWSFFTRTACSRLPARRGRPGGLA
jgi:hypothetical protein